MCRPKTRTVAITSTKPEGSGSNMALNDVSDFAGPFFENRGIATFDKQTGFRFRAGITKEDAAAVRLHFGFSFGNKFKNTVHLLKRLLFADDAGARPRRPFGSRRVRARRR